MQEIIKHRVSEYKKVKDIVTEDDIRELDEQYEEMVFDKEEQQIQQESDATAQQEEITKVEAMIAALEKRYQEVQREGKILDSDISRNNPASISVSSKVSKVNLNRMQSQNKALGSIAGRGNGATRLVALGKKPSIATSIDLSSRNGGRLQTLQTPAAHLRSNIDPNHNQLEQILSR